MFVLKCTPNAPSPSRLLCDNAAQQQSQFRFDNESYLNLPENHKRVSAAATSAVYNNSISPNAAAWLPPFDDSMDASLAAAMMALHMDTSSGGSAGVGGDVVELGATGSSVAGGPLNNAGDVATVATVAAAAVAAAAASVPGAPAIASDEFDFASVSMFFYYLF